MKSNSPLLLVDSLTISSKNRVLLSELSFSIFPNEIVAIVGESGSGKSLTALSIAGLLSDSKLKVESKKLQLGENDLSKLSQKDWESIRGKNIGMVFQEPQSSLNPSMRCGIQVMERLQKFEKGDKKTNVARVLSAFNEVQLPNPERVFKAYPHELSGGQKQRVMIVMALICKPQLLIADEPTTALDVSVQKEILSLIKEQQKINKMSILFISHDLSLVSQFADRVIVMHQGKLIETEKTAKIFRHPKFPYTRALIFARPRPNERLERLPTVDDFTLVKKSFKVVSNNSRRKKHKLIYSNSPILEVSGINKEYSPAKNWFKKNKSFTAIKNLSFKLFPGETLGLVGESGCGKSTLSRILVNLDIPSSGKVIYQGIELNKLVRSKRREIQLVFQDPFAALHPLKTVVNAISEPLLAHRLVNNKKECLKMVEELLEKVNLERGFFNRYPHELSGGQRQRVVIARALATQPRLLILDEAVAALDISVQAKVLNLLNDLKKELELSFLFISHDLNVVKYMSDRIVVMKKGILVEEGEADKLYYHPKNTYTKKMISSMSNI
tara:strand:- start:10414 stop:12081 length:1668 start_codon:yes stop_codon:yes gene_type:complete